MLKAYWGADNVDVNGIAPIPNAANWVAFPYTVFVDYVRKDALVTTMITGNNPTGVVAKISGSQDWVAAYNVQAVIECSEWDYQPEPMRRRALLQDALQQPAHKLLQQQARSASSLRGARASSGSSRSSLLGRRAGGTQI